MSEAKGIKQNVRLKDQMAEFCGTSEVPRTEITKKLWDYIKENKLQTKTENGKPENAGKYIVADPILLDLFLYTNSTSKSGKLTDLREMKEGETTNKTQILAIASSNIVVPANP